MKPNPACILAACLAACVTAAPETTDVGTYAERVLDDMSWITGTWRGDFSGRPFEATYTTASGHRILSANKQFADDGGTEFFEFEDFRIVDDRVVLTPYPAGSRSVSFVLEDYDFEQDRAVFANPEHDWPQRFVYGLVDGDLHIEVAGPGRTAHVRLERVR